MVITLLPCRGSQRLPSTSATLCRVSFPTPLPSLAYNRRRFYQSSRTPDCPGRNPRHVWRPSTVLPLAGQCGQQQTIPTTLGRRTYSVPADRKSSIPDFAFAFDIDGVLLHSSVPLPGASECLSYLQDKNIPFILLTNGGGKFESDRVAELSQKLNVRLGVENFVQSHTPFRLMVDGTENKPSLKDKCILVTGGDGDKCRKVAERYGFKNVVTPTDIFAAYPDIWPFSEAFSAYHSSNAQPLPRPVCPDNPSESLKIDAIFIFNDPRDWALDTQLILDLLISREGILGTRSRKNGNPNLPNHGWQQDGQPHIYCSNPDLFWATGYHLPRLGQGGFHAALRGVWAATTNGQAELDMTVIGKPCQETYEYAEQVLQSHRNSLLGVTGAEERSLRRVFMIGDNPASDIQGANNFKSPIGVQWSSILLKTGVYQDGTIPAHTPDILVDNVMDAVQWGLQQQGWDTQGLRKNLSR